MHNACDNVAQMANVRRLGREGEEAAGIVKNTKRIDSLTGTASHRVPDEIGETWIREVKNVKTLHFSSQLRDSLYTAIEEGKDFRLAIRSNTKLSARLREVIDASWIKLEFLD